MTTSKTNPSKAKTLVVFILTVIIGYGLFILPDIFFGVTKLNGGKIGINLLFIGLFQFVTVSLLLLVALKILQKDFKDIGLQFLNVRTDALLGLLCGALWTFAQFAILIPNTGGNERADITGMLTLYDGSITGTLSFIALGVIGGGLTEELFNRGFFISILKDVFSNPKIGLWASAVLSILIFSLGHLPTNTLEWFDILIPTIIYTLLFIKTKRLTASIVAHGLYNMLAILLTYYFYYS
ncbi:lysostaphin resistance A-like protein [Winogradskyella sp. A3E31]|uniref:CPBP family intramembrane glutamic endopeptidase n=1 Tax=Winogradskyella sp. A3E31 TaxID=3349637 RepID=UPI00398B4B1D